MLLILPRANWRSMLRNSEWKNKSLREVQQVSSPQPTRQCDFNSATYLFSCKKISLRHEQHYDWLVCTYIYHVIQTIIQRQHCQQSSRKPLFIYTLYRHYFTRKCCNKYVFFTIRVNHHSPNVSSQCIYIQLHGDTEKGRPVS